jgi:hypothetical protein
MPKNIVFAFETFVKTTAHFIIFISFCITDDQVPGLYFQQKIYSECARDRRGNPFCGEQKDWNG